MINFYMITISSTPTSKSYSTTANAVAIQMASLIQPCEFDFALCNICFMQWRLVCPPKSWVSYFIVVIILSLILKLTVQS